MKILDKGLKDFRRSWQLVYENKILLLYVLLYDALFIFTYSFMASAMGMVISGFMASSGYFLVQETMNQEGNTLLGMIWQTAARRELLMMFLAFVLLVVFGYVIYCFFQGMSWRVIKEISGEKISVKDMLKGFMKVNLFWGFWIVLYNIIDYFSFLNSRLLETERSFFGLNLFLFILAYFALVSYSTKSKKKVIRQSLIKGLKEPSLVLNYAIMLIIILAASLLIGLVSNNIILVLVEIGVMLPLLAWARVYMNIAVDK